MHRICFIRVSHLGDATYSWKCKDRLKTYFSEKTELKAINSSHTFQNKPGQQALDGPAVYEFKVAQSLPDQRATWFEGLELTRDEQGNTLLTGTIIDQAALHGVFTKIRDLNLILLSVTRREERASAASIYGGSTSRMSGDTLVESSDQGV